jgi:hypothetical protein
MVNAGSRFPPATGLIARAALRVCLTSKVKVMIGMKLTYPEER